MHKVIERILNLLAFLLTAGRPVTAAEIRTTVAGYDRDSDDAFRRMFERDKDLLRQLGIPITMAPTDAWEVEYGYVVPPEDYALADPGLTDEERAALWLAAQVVRVGGQPSGPGAIFKLGGAPLPTSGEPLAADLGADAHALGDAFTAVVERRALQFAYRGRGRTLHPYGLAHRRGHWYLVGEEPGGDDGVKAYRVDRAGRLKVGEHAAAFRRPARFDLDAAIPDAPWRAGEDDLTARVVFRPELAWWARRQLTGAEQVVERPDGSLEVTFRVANPDAFVGWLLGFDDGAELVEPLELRQQLVALVGGA